MATARPDPRAQKPARVAPVRHPPRARHPAQRTPQRPARRAARRPARRVVAHPGRRLVACSALVVLVFGALAFRVTQLQVLSGDRYRRLSLGQTLHTVPLPAQRGAIFDRDGRDLAISIELTSVYVDPTVVTDPIVYAAQLAPVLHESQQLLLPRLSDRKHRFQYLARRVSDSVAKRVRRLSLPGVGTVPESARQYPAGTLAGSVIGQTGGDGSGLQGLEYLYDSRSRNGAGVTLAGKAGQLVVERDEQGLEIPGTSRHEVEARRGTDVVLTLDESLQWETEQSLVDEVTATKAKGGMAVVLDVTSGDVLALASVDGATAKTPAHAAGPGEHSRPLMDLFEPGSTNKLITLSTAIEHGIVGPDTVIDVPPVLMVGSTPYTDVESHGRIRMSVADILRESSNIGTIEIAQNLTNHELADALRNFGLGEQTTVEFPGQAAGLLIDPDKYYATGLASTAIGYGVAVTGMQMLDAYATIANGGVTRPPHLLEATIDGRGTRHDAAAPAGRQVVSNRTATEMTNMLTRVVTGGTGACAAIPGYTIAGKTGTSHKAMPTGGYSKSTMASFIGFAPARHPKLAAIVVLDEPSTVYGGAAAAPVFAAVMQFALTRDGVAPDDATNVQFTAARASAATTGTQCKVPAVAAAEAIAAANRPSTVTQAHDSNPGSSPTPGSLPTDTSQSG